MADSEADIYELFCEPRGELHWLIRACQDRVLEADTPQHLREPLLAAPVLYKVELLIRGRHARLTTEDRARRQNRETRQAEVEVRAATVTLRPAWRHDRKLASAKVNVVLVLEPNPPAGEPPVEWILVTTLPIDTPEQVRMIVEYYCVRWCIEILFRTLKSGCRIERRRFEHIDRVLPCLALYLIVAWRTLFVCRMGRSCPELDCEAIFEPSEWKAVWVAVHHKKLPKKMPRLSEMVHLSRAWVATLSESKTSRVLKPSGSGYSGCTTWRGPGTVLALKEKSAAPNLCGTTRESPQIGSVSWRVCHRLCHGGRSKT